MTARILTLALLLVTILSSAPVATAHAQPGASSSDVYAHGGFHFPRQLGRLVRGETAGYSDPRLGFSVSYGGPAAATLYIYGSGGSGRVANERDTAVDEIYGVTRAGGYEAADLQERSVAPRWIGGVAASTADFKLRRNGQELDSYVIVGLLKQRYVKLRYTAAAGPGTKQRARAVFSAFVAAQP